MIRTVENSENGHLPPSPVGIATLSVTGTLLSINVEGLNMIGYRESDLLGTRVACHVHESEREHLKTVHSALRQSGKGWLQSKHQVRHSNGNYIAIQSHNAVAHDRKKRLRWIISVFLQNNGQNTMKRKISLTQEMTANLAHEINQPLAAIAMYAGVTQQLLHKSELQSDDINHALAQLSNQVYRASDVVARIRSWTNVASAQSDDVDLATLVSSFHPLLCFESEQANLSLETDIETDLPSVHVDAGQIQHVVLAFIRSTIADQKAPYSDNRKLRLSVRKVLTTEIELSVQTYGQENYEILDHHSVHNMDLSSTSKGHSMDLALSNSIILSHGGKIGYKQSGRGSGMLWFTLPIENRRI